MSIKILKFGGTSVKNLGRIEHVAKIIAAGPFDKKIVVVSAMGSTTDELLNLAKQCSSDPHRRELDLLLSTGEQVSIALLTLTLQSMGIAARAFTGQQIGVLTDETHGDARILSIDKATLDHALERYDVLVVAGFQGVTESGEITTLGRGGSDTTAVALAALMGVRECHIYSDVDGICTADPNKTSGTQVYNEISYEEAASLARSGASVIHPRAVELAHSFKIEIHAGNTFKPYQSGTIIKEYSKMEKPQDCHAVALSDKEATIRLCNVPSNQSIVDVINEIAGEGLSLRSLSQKENRSGSTEIVLDITYDDRDSVFRAVELLKDCLQCGHAFINLDIARISLIGRTVASDPTTTARFLSVLSRAGIETRHIECSGSVVSCLLKKEEARLACQLVHDAFHNSNKTSRDRVPVTA